MSTARKGIRAGTRIPMELPVSMRWRTPSGTVRRLEAKTGNISGNGLFIQTSLRLRYDTPIELTVLFPAEANKVPTRLHCEGRVVRQQARAAATGVGVVIDEYDLLSAQPRP